MAITKQEAWTDRTTAGGLKIEIPDFVREVVEEVAFQARADRKIDNAIRANGYRRSRILQELRVALAGPTG